MTVETAASVIPAWVDGVLTPVEKLEVHQRALRHKAISVFIMAGDKTLIQQRALEKYHSPGLWANACCTHPHWEEPALTCAERRLREELGVEGLTLRPRGQVEYRADVGGGLTEHELVDLFLADADESLATPLNPAEVRAVRWVSLDALEAEIAAAPDTFTPWLRIYLAEHRDQLFQTS